MLKYFILMYNVLTKAEKKNNNIVRANAISALENKNEKAYTNGILDQQKKNYKCHNYQNKLKLLHA